MCNIKFSNNNNKLCPIPLSMWVFRIANHTNSSFLSYDVSKVAYKTVFSSIPWSFTVVAVVNLRGVVDAAPIAF